MSDLSAIQSKRVYDDAAEAICNHVEACPECSMTAVACPEGQRLAEAEDAAWRVYRRMRP